MITDGANKQKLATIGQKKRRGRQYRRLRDDLHKYDNQRSTIAKDKPEWRGLYPHER